VKTMRLIELLGDLPQRDILVGRNQPINEIRIGIENGTKARPLRLGQDIARRPLQPGPGPRCGFADRKSLSRRTRRHTTFDRRDHAAAKIRIQRLAHTLLLSLQQKESNQTSPDMGIPNRLSLQSKRSSPRVSRRAIAPQHTLQAGAGRRAAP